uniref:Transcription initiation factor TFIID component TAF4 C-terminal domain-containing protein n=1 Tax=Periophthalmus magnuspinnatus TaxID=409849 RepID=A0A3B4A097_9GOBI
SGVQISPSPAPGRTLVITVPRTATASVTMAPRMAQTTTTQLPANFQIPPDDDINDVASMAGVNLREENAQILTTQVGAVVQSCQDQPFLAPNALLGRPLEVTEVSSEVVALVSHAAQEFLRTLLEKLSVMAQHRKNLIKDNSLHSEVNDVRSQLKFLEDMETLRKKRKDDEERERLLRLARLQHLEQAALQHREANLAALAAIGPRKKRPLELDGQVCIEVHENRQDLAQSILCMCQVCVLPRSGNPRVTRIILRDLLQCMEQDRFLRHSLTLYRAIQ